MANELYKSILQAPGIENMGGFKGRILAYPVHWMKQIPTLPKNPTTLDEASTAEGTFEFLDPSKKPIAIYATRKTVGYKAENQGEEDGQSFKCTGEFFYPGPKAEASGFARIVNNTPFYLVLESPEGDQFIAGQPGLPVSIKPSFDGGKAPADRRGFSFTFEHDSYVPLVKLKTPIDSEQYFVDENLIP